MEWAVLGTCALLAAALVALPWRARGASMVDAAETERTVITSLSEERRLLLAELSELDDDTATGRIDAEDRAAGRRALAPRLLEVTEALHARGIDTRERDS